MGIHSTGKYRSIYLIGTHHSLVETQDIIEEIKNAPFRPSIVCVEAPDGLEPNYTTEHKAVLEYCERNNIEYEGIDQRRGDLYYERDSVNIKNIDEFEDPKTRDKIRQGFDEAKNPNASEFDKEREQMMAMELKELESNGRIVAIVGGMHVEGIIDSLMTLENKY